MTKPSYNNYNPYSYTDAYPRDIGNCVHFFMSKAGQLSEDPTFGRYHDEARNVRRKMLMGPKGEFTEFDNAELEDNLVEAVDGIVDTIWVLMGTLYTWVGAKTALKVIEEINRSNIAKVDGTFGPTVWDGEPGKSKVLKPEGWLPPNVRGILESSGWEFDEKGKPIGEKR